ncbi:glycosyltransferase family 2 protein [Clostridium felsineum]|uniref:Glycosyltransferase 2-like domain-containing protein n=1 Tax=Clostridium felsineum TaxID=36839 RepID=A0A1S8L0D9_9CLOT|nr:glycosyltransferase [Clostridium felsineum]URZ06304.1 hypothetical protein CLROS_016370 [Clostridium felsineum]URZ11339.1 hypothetical protein CROST_020560 [Clostridium felsineum]
MKAERFTTNCFLIKSNHLIEDPKVSIVMCVMNTECYGELIKTIDSILCQLYDDFELIIANDGQKDELLNKTIKAYVDKDNRIIYINNNVKSGLEALRINQALLCARGEYVTYQFTGSYLKNNYLSELIKEVKQHNDCIVYGKSEFKLKNPYGNYILGSEFKYSNLIYCNNSIPNNAIIHKLSIFQECGLMNCSVLLKKTFFWEFLLRIASRKKFIYINKVITECNSLKKIYNNIYIDDLDLMVFRNLEYVNIKSMLKPQKINDYVIDDLNLVKGEEIKNKLLLKFIVPWCEDIGIKLSQERNIQAVNKKKNLLVVKGEFDTSLDIMVTNFIKILNDEYNMIYLPSSQLKEEFLENIDLAIFHRTYDFATNHYLNKLKCMGIPTSYWIDDDLLNFYKLKEEYGDLSPSQASNKKFELSIPGTSIYKELEYQLRNVDVVVSYSPQISNSVEKYNSRIMELRLTVMKKYIEREISQNCDAFKIAFIGTDSRRAEIKFFWQDLLNISNKYKSRVEFSFWGYIPENVSTIKYSKVHTEGFTTSYYEYMNRLKNENFDIIVSPLFNIEPKLAKGLTKYIEAAVCGAIGVYSNVKPYESIEDGKNGFKFENEKGKLALKIEEIIEMDYIKRRKIFNSAKKDIIERHSTESQVYNFKVSIEAIRIHSFLRKNGTICFIISDSYDYRKNEFLNHIVYVKNYGFKIIVCILGLGKCKIKHICNILRESGIKVEFISCNIYDELESSKVVNKKVIDMLLTNDVKIVYHFEKTLISNDLHSELRKLHICNIFNENIIDKNHDDLNLKVYKSFKKTNEITNDFGNNKQIFKHRHKDFWNKIYHNVSINMNVYDYIIFEKFFVGVKEQINIILNDETYNNKNVKYVIWGASNGGNIAKKIIDQALPKFNLIAFVDRYKEGKFEEVNIYKPNELDKLKVEYIFIATSPGRYEAEKFLSKVKINKEIDYMVLFS